MVKPFSMHLYILDVTERIIWRSNLGFKRCNSAGPCCCAIAPCIIGIGTDLLTVGIVYRYNITLQILFKKVEIKCTRCIIAGAVLHSERTSGFVIQVVQQIFDAILRPYFRCDLAAVKIVSVFNSIYCFTCSDTVGVSEGQPHHNQQWCGCLLSLIQSHVILCRED